MLALQCQYVTICVNLCHYPLRLVYIAPLVGSDGIPQTIASRVAGCVVCCQNLQYIIMFVLQKRTDSS